MAERFERPVTTTIDDLYTLARKNVDFETIEQGIINHPEWLTQIPNGRKWGIIHQIVYHGDVDQLNRLLVLQTQNPKFRLLSKTGDNKTVLDIAQEEMRKHEAMHQRIERLATMDDLLNNAKAQNWKVCQDILEKTPEIVNEKPSYRRFYFIHQIAYAGDRKVFDNFNQRYQLDLNLLTSNDRSVVDLANDQRHHDFAHYINSLKEKKQPKETPEQFSRESRKVERAHAADFITTSKSNERDITPVQNNDTPTAIA
jgi:hypothetical protein